MRNAAKENIIVVCTIALCFMLTISLCAAFSGGGLLTVFSAERTGGSSAYVIAVGGYDDITLARSSADLIKQRGGAGYISEGDTIEIIYAVYPDGESANKALTSLGEGSAYVKEIEISASKLKWADKDVKTIAVSDLRYYDEAFSVLYTTANELNSKSIGIDDAKTKIRVLKAQIEDIKSDFYQNIKDNEKEQITEIKLALITSIALLDNINATSNAALYTSSVRYALVQLVFCRQALMNRI